MVPNGSDMGIFEQWRDWWNEPVIARLSRIEGLLGHISYKMENQHREMIAAGQGFRAAMESKLTAAHVNRPAASTVPTSWEDVQVARLEEMLKDIPKEAVNG